MSLNWLYFKHFSIESAYWGDALWSPQVLSSAEQPPSLLATIDIPSLWDASGWRWLVLRSGVDYSMGCLSTCWGSVHFIEYGFLKILGESTNHSEPACKKLDSLLCCAFLPGDIIANQPFTAHLCVLLQTSNFLVVLEKIAWAFIYFFSPAPFNRVSSISRRCIMSVKHITFKHDVSLCLKMQPLFLVMWPLSSVSEPPFLEPIGSLPEKMAELG